jgi:hypothetical protein
MNSYGRSARGAPLVQRIGVVVPALAYLMVAVTFISTVVEHRSWLAGGTATNTLRNRRMVHPKCSEKVDRTHPLVICEEDLVKAGSYKTQMMEVLHRWFEGIGDRALQKLPLVLASISDSSILHQLRPHRLLSPRQVAEDPFCGDDIDRWSPRSEVPLLQQDSLSFHVCKIPALTTWLNQCDALTKQLAFPRKPYETRYLAQSVGGRSGR